MLHELTVHSGCSQTKHTGIPVRCAQIMLAVQRGERPEVPEPGHLPGGTFVGLSHYIKLMRRCWAAEAADRPNVEEVCVVVTSKPLSAGGSPL